MATFRLEIDQKKETKTNLKPADEDNLKKIRRLELLG